MGERRKHLFDEKFTLVEEVTEGAAHKDPDLLVAITVFEGIHGWEEEGGRKEEEERRER